MAKRALKCLKIKIEIHSSGLQTVILLLIRASHFELVIYLHSFHLTGICLSSVRSSCLPRKTWTELHDVTLYFNGTAFCTTVELDHHKGPCRCQCLLEKSSCHERQRFIDDSCSCQCLPSLAGEMRDCLARGDSWNQETCCCEEQKKNVVVHMQCNQADNFVYLLLIWSSLFLLSVFIIFVYSILKQLGYFRNIFYVR